MTAQQRPSRSPRPLSLLGFALLSLAGFTTPAQALPDRLDAGPPPVTARLLCDHKAIAPGQTFRLAVLFDIPPHWHIYWRNPGDSGMPTSVKLTCPPDFQASQPAYPLPQRFEQPGGLHAYGYEKQVMLITTVTAPANLQPGQTTRFQASAQWLACRQVCVPGAQHMSLDLTVADRPAPADPATAQLFDRFADRLPLDHEAHPLDSPLAALVCVPEPLARSYRLEINLLWRQPVSDVRLLPIPDEKIILDPPAIDHHDKQTRITLKTLVLPTRAPDTGPMPALLTYRDRHGQTRGLNIHIKIPPPLSR